MPGSGRQKRQEGSEPIRTLSTASSTTPVTADDGHLRPAPVRKVPRVDGALEGESLRIVAKTGVAGLGILVTALFANLLPAREASGFVLPSTS